MLEVLFWKSEKDTHICQKRDNVPLISTQFYIKINKIKMTCYDQRYTCYSWNFELMSEIWFAAHQNMIAYKIYRYKLRYEASEL